MSKKRMFDTRFWSDVFIVDELNPLDKLLYLYLLLNERSNLIGIYELSIRTAAFETGIDRDQLEKMLASLSPKVEYFDGWIYIRRYADHQQNNPNITTGMAREVAALPVAVKEKVMKSGIVSERLAKAFNEVMKPLEAFESLPNASEPTVKPSKSVESVPDTKLNLTKPNLSENISPTPKAPNQIHNQETKDIHEIFNFYVKSFNAENSHIKLSDKRRTHIRMRLKDAGKEMLFQAITNTANSPFHRGDNDRAWKANIDFIIRSYEQVEKLATMNETELTGTMDPNRPPSKEELERAMRNV